MDSLVSYGISEKLLNINHKQYRNETCKVVHCEDGPSFEIQCVVQQDVCNVHYLRYLFLVVLEW